MQSYGDIIYITNVVLQKLYWMCGGWHRFNYGALDITHSLGVRSTNTISLSVALTQIPHIFSTEWDWIAGGEVMVLTGSLVVK